MKNARRVALAVLAVVVLGEGAMWGLAWRARREAARASAPAVIAAPLDSVNAISLANLEAMHQGDWLLALALQRRIVATLPRDPLAVRQLALAINNCVNATPAPGGGSRYLLRNSLERVRWHVTALAMLDSSDAVSSTPADHAQTFFWKSRLLFVEGMPLDALQLLGRSLALSPKDPGAWQGLDTLKLRLHSTVARTAP